MPNTARERIDGRKRFYPKDANVSVMEVDGLYQVFVWNNGDKYYTVGFVGKSGKPSFNHYGTKDQIFGHIDKWVDNKVLIANKKVEQKESDKLERKKAADRVKVGDVFLNSWGYEQTNTNFYQVVEVKGLYVKVLPISYEIVKDEGGYNYRVKPIKDSFKPGSEPIRRLITAYNEKDVYIKSEYGSCSLVSWDNDYHMSNGY